LRDALAHTGSYLFHELTTPLGLRLERLRALEPTGNQTQFRSFGTFAVWFPRGLLLRRAAQLACGSLLDRWCSRTDGHGADAIASTCARAASDPECRFEAIGARLGQENVPDANLDIHAALGRLLAELDAQSRQPVAEDDPASWCPKALERVRQWFGGGYAGSQTMWQKGVLSQAMDQAVSQAADTWDKRFLGVALGVLELPGGRLAAAAEAITHLQAECSTLEEANRLRRQEEGRLSHSAAHSLEEALAQCVSASGGFSFFGGRSRRLLRSFVDSLSAYARQRLAEGIVAATLGFLAVLRGRLDERLRELEFCRHRVRHFGQSLEAGNATEPCCEVDQSIAVEPATTPHPLSANDEYWALIRKSQTARVVLPDGAEELDEAARTLVQRLSAEQWSALDQQLQDEVMTPSGGLYKVCMSRQDMGRSLVPRFVQSAAECLSGFLPVTDVAEVETCGKDEHAIRQALARYVERATPSVAALDGERQSAFLLAPGSDAGKAIADAAAAAGLQPLVAAGQAEIMLCREQSYLTIEEVQKLLSSCRSAYEETVSVPTLSAHARFDLLDWVPLAP
jgi:hypothetical protein